MKKCNLIFLFFFICIIGYPQPVDRAKAILQQSIDCMGGDSLMKSIHDIHYTGYGYRNAIEQSERPDGPFIYEPLHIDMNMDLQHKKLLQQSTAQMFVFPDNNIRVADSMSYFEKNGNELSQQIQDRLIEDEFDFSPLSILYTAMHGDHLRVETDTILQKNPHEVIAFTWHHYPVKIFINGYTHFLTAYELMKPYNDDFLNIWGDSKKIVYYSFWYLEPNGLHYPRQKDIYINDWPYSSEMITGFDINKPNTADSLTMPSARLTGGQLENQRHENQKKNISSQAKEMKKNVWVITGVCNTTIVAQDDGIVIIEASQSSGYAGLILQKTHELYPGKKIKAVITTSDAWLHIGGLREFASRHIPIYHLDLNHFIIQKLLAASYITQPDSWQKSKSRNAQLVSVGKKITIGHGDNQLQLIPYRTETGERMMMVYFPVQKLLYASDLYQPKMPNGFYWEPHYPFEVCSAIEREHLDVDSLYAMHEANPVSYAEVKKDMQDITSHK